MLIIPAALRKRFGLREGSLVIAEEHEDGVLIRTAIELYTPERKAEFLLSNAVDSEDYAKLLEQVQTMGLDPRSIPHYIAKD
ncbi:MAG: AbrB/MazE/SpoVT family DNA-binding domain-containing protein [bacterium]